MIKAFDNYEIWWVTGAQLLYGGDAVVETSNHLFRVSINCNYGVASIKELCASYPPEFQILKCFNHCC